MLFFASAILPVLSLCSAVLAAPAINLKREPHPAKIVKPAPNSVIYSPAPPYKGATAKVAFELIDGEPSPYLTSVNVFLVQGTKTVQLACNITFYDYTANGTLTIPFDRVPDGNYTIDAVELDNKGQVVGRCFQPIVVKITPTGPHSSRAPHPFEIAEPSQGYIVKTDDGQGQFTFEALDGEQSSEYFAQAFLESSSGETHAITPEIKFDGYVVKYDVAIKTTTFPKGTYQLLAKETRADGSAIETLRQSLIIE